MGPSSQSLKLLLLAASFSGSSSSVGWGRFRFVWYNDLGTLNNHQIQSLHGGDIDGDGAVDLIFPTHETMRLVVMFGDGRGRFNNVTLVAVTPEPIITVFVGDVDGDGAADVASAGDHVWLWRRGRGGFERHWASGAPKKIGTYKGTHSVALADVDGDGRTDYLLARGPSGSRRSGNSASTRGNKRVGRRPPAGGC